TALPICSGLAARQPEHRLRLGAHSVRRARASAPLAAQRTLDARAAQEHGDAAAHQGDPGEVQGQARSDAEGDDEALQGGLQSPRRMSAAAHSVPRADRTLLRVPGNDRVPRRRIPLAAGPLTLRSVLHSARAARRYDVPAAVHHDEVDAGAPREPADEDDDVLHAHLHDGDLPAVRVRAEPVLRVAEHCLDSAADPADARAEEVACVEEVIRWRVYDARSRWRIANGPGTLGGGGFVSLSRAVRWY